jgi:lipoprotein NlpI
MGITSKATLLALLTLLAVPALAGPASEELYKACTRGRLSDSEQIAVCSEAIAGREPDWQRLGALYFERGRLYSATRRYAEAIADYTESLRVNNAGGSFVLHLRGDAWAALGDYDKAIDDYSSAGSDGADADRGIIEFFLGQYAAAAEDLRQRWDRGFDYVEDSRNSIWLYLAMRRTDGPDAARRELAKFWDGISSESSWPAPFAMFLLGTFSVDQMRQGNDADSDEAACDLDFYLGHLDLIDGRRDAARTAFERVAAHCQAEGSNVHRGAVAALKLLKP